MAQEFFTGFTNFVTGASFQEEQEEYSPRLGESGATELSYFGARSVFEDRSSFVERSVFQPSYFEPSYFESSVCEASVCDLSYCEPSVCDVSLHQGSVSTTAYYRRPTQVTTAAPAAPVAPKPIGGPYQPRMEDKVDIAVAEYFKANPTVFSRNRGFARIRPGTYLANGREISVELLQSDYIGQMKGETYTLMVKDGPLRQPLADYLDNKESSAEYSGSVFKAQNALQAIPQGCRMTFCDAGTGYSRLEAMKVAKEQARAREVAASAMNKGNVSARPKVGDYMKTLSFASNASGAQSVTISPPANRRVSIGGAAGSNSPGAGQSTRPMMQMRGGAAATRTRAGGA